MTDQSLTFEEAHEALEKGQTAFVTQAMQDWHPAILADMLLAVGEAKRGYAAQHPVWTRALERLVEADGSTRPADEAQA